MARDPGSLWHPLPEAGAPDGYRKTQFIVHSTGDNGTARSVADNYFAKASVVVESTFIIGLTPDDPTLQLMDSTDNADANLTANQRAISVEVVGDGKGPFTVWQISELIRIGKWAKANHPIASRICLGPSDSGFGWHVMFGAPGPWTTVPGKICPGPLRIAQLKSSIFPAIFGAQEEDIVTPDDIQAIAKQVAILLERPKGRLEHTERMVGDAALRQKSFLTAEGYVVSEDGRSVAKP